MPTSQIEKHLTANMNIKKRNILLANFLGGLAWGIGTVIGATLIVGIIGTFLGFFGVFEPFTNILPEVYR
jgi:hypothetical protein